MGVSRKSWLGVVREKFFRSSPSETIIVLRANNTSSSFTEEATTREEARIEITEFRNGAAVLSSSLSTQNKELLSEEDIAATKIQAYFRRHLARRAIRALKSLVKLQAVVRGVCVRRQARIALHFMHALARLQVTVRARQLLNRRRDD